MSSFICEHCGTAILDNEYGYYTACEHYPIEKLAMNQVDIPNQGNIDE